MRSRDKRNNGREERVAVDFLRMSSFLQNCVSQFLQAEQSLSGILTGAKVTVTSQSGFLALHWL